MICAVAGAAWLGTVARYGLDRWVQHRTRTLLPLGTLAVNVSGALALGVVTGLGLHHGLGRSPRVVVGTGFLGAFTTFSTYAFETLRLVEDSNAGPAVVNALGSIGLGLLAAAIGLAVTASVG